MRIALIVSIILHVLFMIFSGHDLLATTHGEVIKVDIVPANEAPAPLEETKPDKDAIESKPEVAQAKPETQLSERGSERAPAEQQTARDRTEKPSQVPPPANEAPTKDETAKSIKQNAPPATDPKPNQAPADQPGAQSQSPGQQAMTTRDMAPDRLAAILGLPADSTRPSSPAGFGRAPERLTKLTEGVKELKAQLNKCFVLPPGVARTDRIKMIMRVELTRDGALARDPIVLDGAAPAIGYPMMLTAIRALRRCAPYHLPADKYADWQMLEIDFSPDDMLDN
ncbi:MAG: hypothetical protein JO289_09945 [Xanthobacteraceae bacterium]|nr:hypothetical protein [Xanthobacteraceae bacterium]